MSDELQIVGDEMMAEKIYYLRRSGYSVQEISERLDIQPNAVIALYNSMRMRMASNKIDRDELKSLLMERYEALLAVNFEMALQGDEDSTKNVLAILREEVKLNHLDQMDPSDAQVTQNILVVGNDREGFIEALRAGRKPVAVDETIEAEEEANE